MTAEIAKPNTMAAARAVWAERMDGFAKTQAMAEHSASTERPRKVRPASKGTTIAAPSRCMINATGIIPTKQRDNAPHREPPPEDQCKYTSHRRDADRHRRYRDQRDHSAPFRNVRRVHAERENRSVSRATGKRSRAPQLCNSEDEGDRQNAPQKPPMFDPRSQSPESWRVFGSAGQHLIEGDEDRTHNCDLLSLYCQTEKDDRRCRNRSKPSVASRCGHAGMSSKKRPSGYTPPHRGSDPFPHRSSSG